MWRNPMPWKNTPTTPNLGKIGETDDIRPGPRLDGLKHLEDFVRKGGVFIGAVGSATFAVQFGLTHGVSATPPAPDRASSARCSARGIVDDTSPIVYGIPRQPRGVQRSRRRASA